MTKYLAFILMAEKKATTKILRQKAKTFGVRTFQQKYI